MIQQMKKIFLLFLIISLHNINAQEAKKSKIPDWMGNIEQQFKDVYSKSGKYQEYKVIKATWYNKLRKNVTDTLSGLNKQIYSQNKKINALQKEIKTLNNKISDREVTISELKKQKDSIRFFGMDVSKATYNMILWLIIAALAIGLVFFIYRFINSNAVTKETLEKYKELSDEYQGFRTRSLEREQSLKRQLIDEMNKHNS